MLSRLFLAIALFSAVTVFSVEIDLKNKNLYNETAYITSQCYTKTVDKLGVKHNPCYSCHIKSKIPNYMSDEDVQESYAFPQYATKNRWTNLFKDRSKQVSKITDKNILAYIKQDNYKNKNSEIIISSKLKNIPTKWDFNNNGKWDGYTPDCEFNFDEDGFDRKNNGTLTGWRAFKYRPFLGTFWPTNGSTDDVLIRLPKLFWLDENKRVNLDIYKKNLLIVEDLIKQNKEHKSYVGQAKKQKIALGLYPVGTEFLHSVRYIEPTQSGVKLSVRMKELRYAKKLRWANYHEHQSLSDEEFKENHDFPDRYSVYIGDIESGIYNKRGWVYQGFIEDAKGELRPQSYEETLYCIGCHANIGAISDSTFAYARKFEWGYWDKKGLDGISDKKNEYLNYLKNNNHANEFRTNQEVYNKFFKNNKLDIGEAKKIKNNIAYLLNPSKKRALNLNKAYKVIVEEQSFIYGRDAHIKPLENVYKEVEQDKSTKLTIIEYH